MSTETVAKGLLCDFWVDGKPITKGSMRHIGKGRVIPDTRKTLTTWVACIKHNLRQRYPDMIPVLKPEGVVLHLDFTFRRPKSVRRELMTVKPDVDKLARAVLDALSGMLYEDDAQVTELSIRKGYSLNPGCQITAHEA